MKRFVLLVLLASSAHAAGRRPTENGDAIGVITLLPNGKLHMQLSSVDCGGVVAGVVNDLPADSVGGKKMLRKYGPLEVGKPKPMKAEGLAPCPKT